MTKTEHNASVNLAAIVHESEEAAKAAALREMADPDRQDELPQRRHLPGQHHALSQMLREAFTARDDEDDDHAA